MYYCRIGTVGAEDLSKVLVHCKNLRCLDLSWNVIGSGGVGSSS